MSELLEKPVTIHRYVKANDLDLELISPMILVLSHVWWESKDIIKEYEFDHYLMPSSSKIPLASTQSPFLGLSADQNNPHENFKTLAEHGDIGKFVEHTNKVSITLMNISTLTLLAEHISNLEEEQEAPEPVKVSKETIKEIHLKVQNTMRHAAYLILTDSPALNHYKLNDNSAKKSLAKMLLGDCGLVESINNTYSLQGVMRVLDNNAILGKMIARL